MSQFFERLPFERTPVRFRSPVEEVLRFGEGDSVIKVFHACRVVVWLVGGFEMAAHQERLVAVLLLDPVDRFFCDEVGGETGHALAERTVARPWVAAFDESRVAVFSLVVENGIIVEPLRLRFDMPFTDKSGIVAVGLQDGCQCGN